MGNSETTSTTDAMQVEIAVEVGEVTMSVAEVDQLKAGSIIDFGGVSPMRVKVRANGEVFADASMIEIGDGFGLKINRML